jgi:thiamine biosynthesis lipoprotein
MNKSTHIFKAMGGEFQLMCFPQSTISYDHVHEIFLKAEKEVLRVEKKFTDFHNSPLNDINNNAGINPVTVDEELFTLVSKAIDISKQSQGIFDISYASVGHPWREAKKNGQTLSSQIINELKAYIDYKRIEFDANKQTIYLPHPKIQIGLGGIGKGYAVDQAYEVLKKNGLYNFYINGSGDIRVHSHPEAPRLWRVGIRNPFSKDPGQSAGVIQIKDGSVASSGGYIHKNTSSKHQQDHHIIEPKSGQSHHELIATTVLADDAITADTTATILMNLSAARALSYLDQLNLSGFVIDQSGKSHLSQKALASFGK